MQKMDMNTSYMQLDEVCVGCLSTKRRLEPLAGAARLYFNDIVEEAVGESRQEHVAVCWECASGVRRALILRTRVATAAAALRTHQKYLYEMSLQRQDSRMYTSPVHLQSLSRLSCHTNTCIVMLTSHEDHPRAVSQDVESGAPYIKQENTNDELDDVEGCYVEDVALADDHNDLKAVLNTELFDHESITKHTTRKKKKKRQKAETVEFDESDEEPLTLKKLKQENKRPRDNRIKQDNDAESGANPVAAIGARAGRVARREQAAGEVRGERVAARLRALRVPPGHLAMVVLSWEEVEAERQRALRDERYTRHELRCEPCALGFNQRAKLAQHLQKHDPSAGDLECSACRIRCREPHALAAHRRRHRVRWRCALCGALWSRAAVAADHLARAHQLPAAAHSCPTCAHVAPTLGKLRTHLKEHGLRARCHVCGKSLRDKASLKTHLQIHAGVKEHMCPHAACGKRFVFKKAMQLHADTHRASQHLYCHECDMTFKNQTTFYHHMKYSLKHVHPDKLKHACGSCARRFLSARRLDEHRAAVHLRTTPVACHQPDCHFACASRPALRAHVAAVHRGVRPRRDHVCHACGKAYTTKKTLEGHLRSHSGERPFRCEQCGASFGYHAALYNHARLVHHKHKAKRSRVAPTATPAAIQAPVAVQPQPRELGAPADSAHTARAAGPTGDAPARWTLALTVPNTNVT